MRYLLDEDVNPAVARVARGRGVDARSIHELDRAGLSDRVQLRLAAGDGRVFVTYNRDDFRRLTVEFFHARRPHAGVLVVPRSLRRDRPEEVARALARYEADRGEAGLAPYTFDFLRP